MIGTYVSGGDENRARATWPLCSRAIAAWIITFSSILSIHLIRNIGINHVDALIVDFSRQMNVLSPSTRSIVENKRKMLLFVLECSPAR